jgi:hypothetical protein
MLLTAGAVWMIKDPMARSMIDAANVVSMLIGGSMFDRLKPPKKLLVVNIFYIFIISNFAICVLQFISADFQVFTSSFFTADYRPSVLDTVRTRNGGVTGLGPEPAYCAVLVIGLGLIVSAYKPEKFSVVLIVIGTLLLLRSVSGFMYGFIYLLFFVSQQNRQFITQFFKLLYVAIPTMGLYFYFNIEQAEWARFSEIGGRLIQFFVLLGESGSFLQAEAQFGSDRLVGIYLSFSKIIISEYGTGYSPAAALNFLFGTSLISIFVAAILILIPGRGISYLLVLVFVFISGPKLMWPIFYFGLFGTEKINIEKKYWKLKFANGGNS